MAKEDTQFKIGNPGGPGRPKGSGFKQWCKRWSADRAEIFLRPIAEDPTHKQQIEAIKLIIAYAEGKPEQTINATMNQNPLQDLTNEELENIRNANRTGTNGTGLGACSQIPGGTDTSIPTEPGPTKVD